MTDRNGVNVYAGDRVMVFLARVFRSYGKIITIADCSCGFPGCRLRARVKLVSLDRQVVVGPNSLELPVAAAIARGREP